MHFTRCCLAATVALSSVFSTALSARHAQQNEHKQVEGRSPNVGNENFFNHLANNLLGKRQGPVCYNDTYYDIVHTRPEATPACRMILGIPGVTATVTSTPVV